MLEYAEDVKQAATYLPGWLAGDPSKPDSKGLIAIVADRRAELDPDSSLNRAIYGMEQCDTMPLLDRWKEDNAAYLETLDGAESRRMQAALDAQEARITAMDQSGA